MKVVNFHREPGVCLQEQTLSSRRGELTQVGHVLEVGRGGGVEEDPCFMNVYITVRLAPGDGDAEPLSMEPTKVLAIRFVRKVAVGECGTARLPQMKGLIGCCNEAAEDEWLSLDRASVIGVSWV